jgi:hypothetical protein
VQFFFFLCEVSNCDWGAKTPPFTPRPNLSYSLQTIAPPVPSMKSFPSRQIQTFPPNLRIPHLNKTLTLKHQPSQTHLQSRHESPVSEAPGGPQSGRCLGQQWARFLLLRPLGPTSPSPGDGLLFRPIHLHPRPSSILRRS